MSDLQSEFSYPRPNLIVSRGGFSVEVVGRSAIRYEEAGGVIEIFAEMLVGPKSEIVVRRRDVRAWQGRQGQGDLDEIERDRIVENIKRAFAFKGWILVVD